MHRGLYARHLYVDMPVYCVRIFYSGTPLHTLATGTLAAVNVCPYRAGEGYGE